MAKLAAWPFAAAVRSMDLKDNPITDAGGLALADSPWRTRPASGNSGGSTCLARALDGWAGNASGSDSAMRSSCKLPEREQESPNQTLDLTAAALRGCRVVAPRAAAAGERGRSAARRVCNEDS